VLKHYFLDMYLSVSVSMFASVSCPCLCPLLLLILQLLSYCLCNKYTPGWNTDLHLSRYSLHLAQVVLRVLNKDDIWLPDLKVSLRCPMQKKQHYIDYKCRRHDIYCSVFSKGRYVQNGHIGVVCCGWFVTIQYVQLRKRQYGTTVNR
jgi:hypothetical protein